MIEIPERDTKFLIVLNETGACNYKFTFRFYPCNYAKDRLHLMDKSKLIKRKYDLKMLSVKVEIYLKSIGEMHLCQMECLSKDKKE
jgi:hypothetical protein